MPGTYVPDTEELCFCLNKLSSVVRLRKEVVLVLDLLFLSCPSGWSSTNKSGMSTPITPHHSPSFFSRFNFPQPLVPFPLLCFRSARARHSLLAERHTEKKKLIQKTTPSPPLECFPEGFDFNKLKKKIPRTNGAYYPHIGNALPSSIRVDLIQISVKGMFRQKEHPSRVGKELTHLISLIRPQIRSLS